MNCEDTINLTDKLLKSIPDIKERIRLINIALKKDSHSINTIQNLKKEQRKLNIKLSNTIKAIGKLDNESQRIICYRYFEGLNYKEISIRVGLSHKTIPRKIKEGLLDIGRVLFGMEDEFWNEVLC